MRSAQEILSATKYMDWRMVIVNGGPPCFHIGDDGLFCGLSERWKGHCHPGDHDFVSLTNLLESMETYAHANLLDRLQKAEQQLKEAVSIIKESKGFVIYKVPLQWINRSDAFLASQKDAK